MSIPTLPIICALALGLGACSAESKTTPEKSAPKGETPAAKTSPADEGAAPTAVVMSNVSLELGKVC